MIKIKNARILLTNKKYLKRKRVVKIASEVNKAIDAEGLVLIRGFKNLHVHLGSSATTTFPNDLKRYIKLEEKLWKRLNRSYWEKITSILLLLSGNVEIWSIRGEKITNLFGFFGKSGIPISSYGYLKKLKDFYIKKIEEGKIEPYTHYFFIHSIKRTKLKEIKKTIELANEYSMEVFLHFFETKDERAQLKKMGYHEPLDFLTSIGFPEESSYLIHCTYLSREEILEVSKKFKIVVSPFSNIFFSNKLPSIDRELLEKMINKKRIFLGSDGIGNGKSCGVLDLAKFLFIKYKINPMKLLSIVSSDKGFLLVRVPEAIKKTKEVLYFLFSSSLNPEWIINRKVHKASELLEKLSE